MNDNELLLNATLESLRAGESTPALVYADYLEERNRIGPQFFRSLARQFIEYPDWVFMEWIATDLGGGYWPHSTTNSRYIQFSIGSAQRELTKDRPDIAPVWWMGVTPEVAATISRSQEIRDSLYVYRHFIPDGMSKARADNTWLSYGLPAFMFSVRLWVFDRNVVPPDCAVILCEQIKVLGLIRECYPIDR